MQNRKRFVYLPSLQLKQGEYFGLARLAVDVADRVVPRLIIPPPKERDPEKSRELTFDEIIHLTGRRIGEHWPMRAAFLDPHYLFSAFRESDSKEWLPRMFNVARNANANPIPVATLEELLGPQCEAFRLVINRGAQRHLALRIQYSEIDDALLPKVRQALTIAGTDPSNCTIMLDFSEADMSNIEDIAEFAVSSFENVQAIGRWQEIVFQATNFPEKNPASEESIAKVSRKEWLAWKRAIEIDTDAAIHLLFGDYCADSAPAFRTGRGGRPIKHYRYCTSDSWLVARGRSDQSYGKAMQWVAKEILDSGSFAGRDFSSADEFIYETACGLAGPGNATVWREINTAHHITQVVSDISKIKGFGIARRLFADANKQLEIF
jgi:hypothetical protein